MHKLFSKKILAGGALALAMLTTVYSPQLASAEDDSMVNTALTMQMYGDYSQDLFSTLPYYQVKKEGKWGVLTSEGKELLPCVFDRVIFTSGKEKFIAVVSNKKWGLYSEHGQELLAPQFTTLNVYDKDLVVVSQNGKTGVVNSQRREIVPLQMLKIKPFLGEKIIAAQRDKTSWEFYSLEGKLLFSRSYKDVQGVGEGLISVVNEKKQIGYIDATGKEIVPPTYKKAFDFSEGLALVQKQDEKLALLDKNGREIAQLPGKELGTSFAEGVATVRDGNQFTGIDTTGKAIFTVKAFNVSSFHDGIAPIQRKVSKMNLGGLAASVVGIAITGGSNIAVAFDGDGGISFGAGYPYSYYRHYNNGSYYGAGYHAALDFNVSYKDYKMGYIDKKGNEIIPTKNDLNGTLSGGKILVKKDDKYGYVDVQGNPVVPAEYEDISYFTKSDADIVAVEQKDKYAFYQLGKGIVSRWYEKVKPYQDGLAAVDLGENNWVYINRQGNRISPLAKYKYAQDFSEGVATVELENKRLAVIDSQGEKVVDTTTAYKKIEASRYGLIPVQDKNNKWGFLNKKGQSVVQPHYDAYK